MESLFITISIIVYHKTEGEQFHFFILSKILTIGKKTKNSLQMEYDLFPRLIFHETIIIL